METRVDDLKITLILQKRRFLLILLCKRVFKSSHNLPRNGKTITKSFFSAYNVTSLVLSESFIEKVFHATIYQFDRKFILNDKLLNEILKNPKQSKTFEIIKRKSNFIFFGNETVET